jgi:glycosyltransferase involved in cell wall biosynthesis
MPVCANPKEMKKVIPLYAGRLKATLRRGKSFICFSEKDRSWLAARGHLSEDKIELARPVPYASAAPLSPGERETIKGTYAQGKEFFFVDVSAVDEDGLIYLLKAFSLFKKRQRSNLQLVMAGEPGDKAKEKLQTYKYRQDIHWCSASAAQHGRLMAAAYAVLFLFEDDSPGTAVLNAWQTGVPVLVAGRTRLAEMAGDAALVAAAVDPVALAGHLMAVYKDEALRGRLIEKGYYRAREFAPGQTITRVWAVIGGPYAINK